MFLPFLVIFGYAIQGLVSKVDRKAGAVIGFVVTTLILIFGLMAYEKGGYIELVGLELPFALFIGICIILYGYNTYGMVQVIRSSFKLNLELFGKDNVINFYKHTIEIWATGVLDILDKGFKKESKFSYKEFLKLYGPYEGGIFELFFTKNTPLLNEYFIGFGEKDTGIDRGWFILTNYRLIIKDGKANEFCQIVLPDVSTFSIDENKSLLFKFKSGEEKKVNHVLDYPKKKYLEVAIQLSGK